MNLISRWTTTLALAGGLFGVALFVTADAPLRAAPAPLPAQDGDSDVDRALQEVEALLGELRGTPNADASVIRRLESIATRLRKAKASGPRSGGDAEGEGSPSSPGTTPEDFLKELSSWVTDRLYEDVELRPDQRAVSDDIAQRFYTDYSLARDQKDDKSKQAILSDTKARFDNYLPKRAAMRLNSNLDGLVRRWEWRGGRGGR